MLDKDDEGKRILYVIPQSAGDVFMSTSLFPSIKRIYPEYNLYVATDPKFQPILDGNNHIHKILPYVHSTLTKKLNILKSLNLITYEKETGSYKSQVIIHKTILTKYNINLLYVPSCTIMSQNSPSTKDKPPPKPPTPPPHNTPNVWIDCFPRT